MKWIMARVLVVLLIVFALSVLAPVVALAAGVVAQVTPPVIPEELEKLIELGIGFLVILGLKDLGDLLGRDLSGWQTAATALVVGVVIYTGNALIAFAVTINPDAAAFIIGLFQIASIVLAMFGVARLKRGAKWVREVKGITPKSTA